MFDSVTDTFRDVASLAENLDAHAPIVESPTFEVAIVKVQSGREHQLIGPEKLSVQNLLRPGGTSAVSSSTEKLSPADEWLGRGKKLAGANSSKYIDLRFIMATSNNCERLFSVEGMAMGNRRKGMLPSTFEEQMFLHFNSIHWGIEDVHEILQRK